MKKGFEYWDCFSLLLVAISYFLTSKGILPLFLYSVVSVIVIFTIVFGKLFFTWGKKPSEIKDIVFYALSNLVVALLVSLTMLYLVIPKDNIMLICSLILRLLNIFCMLYFICKSRQKDAIFCLCGLFLPSYWSI